MRCGRELAIKIIRAARPDGPIPEEIIEMVASQHLSPIHPDYVEVILEVAEANEFAS